MLSIKWAMLNLQRTKTSQEAISPQNLLLTSSLICHRNVLIKVKIKSWQATLNNKKLVKINWTTRIARLSYPCQRPYFVCPQQMHKRYSIKKKPIPEIKSLEWSKLIPIYFLHKVKIHKWKAPRIRLTPIVKRNANIDQWFQKDQTIFSRWHSHSRTISFNLSKKQTRRQDLDKIPLKIHKSNWMLCIKSDKS